MKIINPVLLVIELLICLIPFSSYKITFGHGEADDIIIFGLFYLGVITHLIWTIILVKKEKGFKLPTVIFSILTIFIILKASFLRGLEFPWDGEIIVNHGRLKPSFDDQIIYTVLQKWKSDSVYKIILPDPGKKYMSTLWVSDPECTGCNDCMIDSGELLVPDTLKNFKGVHDILLLDGKSPYQVEREPYVRYMLKGQVTGIKNGKFIFYVSEWERR